VQGLDRAAALFKRVRGWLHAALLAKERWDRQAKLRARAEQRARSLLLNLLNDEQRYEFEAHGFFYVTGGGSRDRYRIRLDSAVNVDLLGEDGKVRYHLCARPTGDIPMYDVMAGQLLFLQDRTTETHFLAQAKKHVTLSFPPMLR
jgi:hypothetical protein